MHTATHDFMAKAAACRCLTDDTAEDRAEALLDEIELILVDAMSLRREYRRLERVEEAEELRGRLGGYESKLRALDRDGTSLVAALEVFRMTLSHLKRADVRLTQWVADFEAREADPAAGPGGVPDA